MKFLILIFFFFMTCMNAISQDQSIAESNVQIGMLNPTSSKNGFSFVKNFDLLSLQVASLPLFASKFEIYSCLGVSGQLTVNENNFGKVYTYAGFQRIQTKLGNTKEHINFGVGFGFKTNINNELGFVYQGGYNSMDALKSTRNTVFNSEVGVFYHF